MAKTSSSDLALSPIERPRCGKCDSRMMLVHIAPLQHGSERRMFECPKCHTTEITVVADPLQSEEVERLTTNVRPPAR